MLAVRIGVSGARKRTGNGIRDSRVMALSAPLPGEKGLRGQAGTGEKGYEADESRREGSEGQAGAGEKGVRPGANGREGSKNRREGGEDRPSTGKRSQLAPAGRNAIVRSHRRSRRAPRTAVAVARPGCLSGFAARRGMRIRKQGKAPAHCTRPLI